MNLASVTPAPMGLAPLTGTEKWGAAAGIPLHTSLQLWCARKARRRGLKRTPLDVLVRSEVVTEGLSENMSFVMNLERGHFEGESSV